MSDKQLSSDNVKQIGEPKHNNKTDGKIKNSNNKTEASIIDNIINEYNSKDIHVSSRYSRDNKDKTLIDICENVSVTKPYINYEYNVKINEYIKNKTHYDNDAIVRLKIMHQYITDAMNILLTNNGFANKV